jgi:PST family polysaccharide transporter
MWILLDAVAVWLTAHIGTFIVGRQLDDYYLGLYKTSMTTINSITNIFAASIAPVMFSQLSRCQGNDAEMKKTFYTYQRLAGLLLIPMGVGMYLYRDLLCAVLLGEQWVEATEFLGIWGLISTITIVFCNFCSTYYRSKGQPKISLFAQIMFLCVLVPSLIFSVRVSFRTLCLARSFVTVFAVVLAFIIMRVFFKFKIHETIFNILPIILSTFVMVGVALGLQQLGSLIVWQFVSIFICIICWLARKKAH